mgnify:CR=1 FL=1
MVSSLVEYSDLLSLLLKAEIVQKKAILDSLDPGQVDFIGELVHNFLTTFPIGKAELRKLIKRNTFKEIANFKKSNRYRKTLIKKNKKFISQLLDRHKDKLSTLTKQANN